jgi:hypothetical protein
MSEINPIEGELLEKAEYIDAVPIQVNESVDPSDVIKTTQTIRLAMVKQTIKAGLPEVGEGSRDFLGLLRDLDTAALTTRKIDVDEKNGSDAERLAAAHTELLRMMGGKNPFAADIEGLGKGELTKAVRSVPELPEPTLVPGITDIGTHNVDYDEFAASVSGDDDAGT